MITARNAVISIDELVKVGFSSGVCVCVVGDLDEASVVVGSCGTRFNTFAGKNGINPAPLNAEFILDAENAFARTLTYADNTALLEEVKSQFE